MGLPRITYPLTFNGRTFSVEELRLMQTLTVDCAALARTELAYTLCELVDWRRPTGRLKNHEGRLLLEQLEARGLVRLPPVRDGVGRRGPREAPRSAQGAPAPEVGGVLPDVLPLALEVVPPGRTGPSRLWRELIGRYHYLGDRVPVGATLRYVVRSAQRPDQILACLGWTSAAWKITVRDRWIGWSDAQRRQALPYVVNNSRFLILPWVEVPHLASHLLGLMARRFAPEWERTYGIRPVLLQTLVEQGRAGTFYRAANCIALGPTTGRGRMDRHDRRAGLAIKEVFAYPLRPRARQLLRGEV